jgi:hypothetical protein
VISTPSWDLDPICTMPPRSSLTSSFSVTDANNEVVCPLKNNDSSNCRKRCLGVSPSPPPSPERLQPHLYLGLCSWSSGDVQPGSELTRCSGKTLSLHAGAYSTCASEPLHPEAPGDRGELPTHGEHPARATGAAVSSRTRTTPAASRSVCSLPLACPSHRARY